MKQEPQTLKSFIVSQQTAKRSVLPWIETIPEWLEICEAYKSGVAGIAQIAEWLVVERGYPRSLVTVGKVAYLSRAIERD